MAGEGYTDEELQTQSGAQRPAPWVFSPRGLRPQFRPWDQTAAWLPEHVLEIHTGWCLSLDQ